MPKYLIVFPERPDDVPAVPPDELVRKVNDLVRRSIELGQTPEALDPELARYVTVDPFDVSDESASPPDATPSRQK